MSDDPPPYRKIDTLRLAGDERIPATATVIEEVPICLRYNAIPHVVLMATPADLQDLAIGFSITDGICHPGEIERCTHTSEEGAFALDVQLAPPAFARFLQRRQRRPTRSYTSCGICGIEDIQSLPQIQPIAAGKISPAALRRALKSLPDHQPLNRLTGAVHAAAFVAPDGEIVCVREDVGRHNALDKLIGARARLPAEQHAGFCLVTSRCSFEMVQKTTAAGMTLLVCISAPTTLAISEAERAGLALVALARADNQTVYVGRQHLADEG
jgi:FdhD protein